MQTRRRVNARREKEKKINTKKGEERDGGMAGKINLVAEQSSHEMFNIKMWRKAALVQQSNWWSG